MKILQVYGTGNPEFIKDYKKCAEESVQKNRFVEMIVKPDTAVTAEDIQTIPISLIGTPTSNLLLRKMSDSLPIQFKNNNFSINKIITSEDQDIYSLRSYPNPLNLSMPIFLTTGNNDKRVIDFLARQDQSSVFTAGDFVVYRDDKVALWGLFKQVKNGPWEIEKSQTRNYLHNKKSVLETEHYVFNYMGARVKRSEFEKIANKQEKRIQNLLDRLNLSIEKFPKIKSYLYESPEDKGLITRNTDLSHFNLEAGEVHSIFT